MKNASYGSTDDRTGAELKLEAGGGEDETNENPTPETEIETETEELIPKASPPPKASPKPKPYDFETSDTDFFTALTFNWISPLLTLGNTKPQLNPEDLEALPLPPSCQTQRTSSLFQYYWEGEVQYAEHSTRFHRQKHNHKHNHKGRANGRANASGSKYSYVRYKYKYKKKQPSIARSLAMAYGTDFLKAGILKFIHDANVFVGPIVLHGLIQFLRDENAPMSRGIYLTIAVTISQTLMSFCLRHYFFKCYMTGLRMRTAIVVAVYQKSLVLSTTERQRRTVGEIVNLMTVDAQRIQDLTTYLHAIWYSFFQIGVSIYFLWQQLGISCLGGVAIILIMVPVNKVIAAWMGRLQKRLMNSRDERLNVNNEVLSSMKVIKLQAWEGSFQDRILQLRDVELRQLYRYVMANAFSIMMWSAVPLLIALSTFAAYTFLGNSLDVASALTALALFDILRFPLFMLPQVVNNLIEAAVSFDRVSDFLLSEEHCPVAENGVGEGEVKVHCATFIYDSKKPRYDGGFGTGTGTGTGGNTNVGDVDEELVQEVHDKEWEIRILKAQLKDAEEKIMALSKDDFGNGNENETGIGNQTEDKSTSQMLTTTVEDDSSSMPLIQEEKYMNMDNNSNSAHVSGPGSESSESPADLLALRRIDLNCTGGELIAIVGQVGSGKSSLLNSLLGEVKKLSGDLAVRGRLAYFPQTPFIMNDTLQRNITFGRTNEYFDKERYDLAVSTCALEHDITMLSGGDQTEIGEKGITLSGGQKARVAMARAVYHDADIYLLDDPLAAVDAHVGKHMFQKCIVDELLLRKSSTSRLGGEKKSSVILVTNAIQYLSNPNVSKIVVLDGGSIAEVGTYEELSSRPDSLFSSFLAVLEETGTGHSEESTDVGLDLNGIVSPQESTNLPQSDDGLDDEQIDPDLSFSASNSSLGSSISMECNEATSLVVKPSSDDRMNGTDGDRVDNDANHTSKTELMTDELKEREVGHVDPRIYLDWAKAGGGLWVALVLLLGYVIDQGVSITSKWWLTYWSRNGGENEYRFLRIYAYINMLSIFTMFGRVVLVYMSGLRASRLMFAELLDVMLRAPMAFFDTTPVGRIVNRFSKDMFILDEKLVNTLRSYMATLSNVIGTIVVVSAVTPSFTLFLIPIIAFYGQQQVYFTKTYRELKRLDSVSRSPLYALLGETLDGLSTIRAFNAEASLKERLVDMLDQQQNAYFLTTTAQCWLAIRLEMIGTLIIFACCICAVLEHRNEAGNETFAGLAGLAISFALSVTQSLNWSVRMGSDLEAHMISVERIKQYCDIPSEAPHALPEDSSLQNWPKNGEIVFSGVKLRYRPNLPLVLKGLDIKVPALSKVGVVGRTGAGKSTLMVSLLRLVELSDGSIEIDGVNINKVGLNVLRSKIAVIPQDPVLFSGTVRTNLDPFMEYEDERLDEVLQRVGLKAPSSVVRVPSVRSLNSLSGHSSEHQQSMAVKSLNDEVVEGGSNFSVGQRQLLVIARALLRRAKIVIMDEATASVDADTDARIQRVMRTEFKGSTCITVAHRINTILDSDFILVMNDGRAEEFDTPETLLAQGGLFKDLVDAWEQEHDSNIT